MIRELAPTFFLRNLIPCMRPDSRSGVYVQGVRTCVQVSFIPSVQSRFVLSHHRELRNYNSD